MLVSARICRKPLYHREYWNEGVRGSLRTSVAASLVRLVHPGREAKIVDNLCGSGTILCEAEKMGLESYGGDRDEEAIASTKENIVEISQDAAERINNQDARSTEYPDNEFEIAVSNLPWGKQVDSGSDLFPGVMEEYSRILKPDGRIVLLNNHRELVGKYLRENFPGHETGGIRLGMLGQQPVVSYAVPDEECLNKM
ncbi:MAG: TRM11 family methyltransferase [Candidatus Nanohaloarchaea archaeon]